jgi:hypothetical protein
VTVTGGLGGGCDAFPEQAGIKDINIIKKIKQATAARSLNTGFLSTILCSPECSLDFETI